MRNAASKSVSDLPLYYDFAASGPSPRGGIKGVGKAVQIGAGGGYVIWAPHGRKFGNPHPPNNLPDQ